MNDGEQGQRGQGNMVTTATPLNTAQHARAREPYARGIQIQEQRPAAHQRNHYYRNYHNRYYGNQGNHGGGGGGGGGGYRYGGADYERQPYQQNYMHGPPVTFHPAYGHCRLCGKYYRLFSLVGVRWPPG